MRLRDLTFGYGRFPVFSGLDADFNARVTVLKGPSGCGKTTLLKLLAGVLRPAEGTIIDVPADGCLILQEDALFPWLTGTQNICDLLHIRTDTVQRHPMFNTVKGFIAQRAHAMSFGQRRKLELFRAVLFAPPLLCLDEPFNFLDPRSREEIAVYLQADTLPHTQIVLSTHLDDDLSILRADVHRFDGSLPVCQLITQ